MLAWLLSIFHLEYYYFLQWVYLKVTKYKAIDFSSLIGRCLVCLSFFSMQLPSLSNVQLNVSYGEFAMLDLTTCTHWPKNSLYQKM